MKDATPDEISEKIWYSDRGGAVKIGKVLRKKVNRVAKNGFKLTYVVIDADKKTHGWKLEGKPPEDKGGVKTTQTTVSG
jgi:hypothetical protein